MFDLIAGAVLLVLTAGFVVGLVWMCLDDSIVIVTETCTVETETIRRPYLDVSDAEHST